MQNNKFLYTRWVLLRLALAVFDVFAVNVSFYLAILTRFYVANEFHSVAAGYVNAFISFAPYYTVFCLAVFACFRLYSGMWRYAGLNDMNRIVLANLVAFAGQIIGSLLFVRRMPITYYVIGSVTQFILIAASRFGYRLVVMEMGRLKKGEKPAFRAMIVGSGETGRIVLKQMERENAAIPVCVLNYRAGTFGTLLDGVPVVSGVENLQSAAKKYQISLVILADSLMPSEVREEIKDLCRKANLEVQDFSGYFQNGTADLTLKALAERCSGALELVIDGKSQKFADGEQALMSIAGKYIVKSVSAKRDTLMIELHSSKVVPNDLNENWVKDQEKTTGEEISFF